jgi:hypothetical protein
MRVDFRMYVGLRERFLRSNPYIAEYIYTKEKK